MNSLIMDPPRGSQSLFQFVDQLFDVAEDHVLLLTSVLDPGRYYGFIRRFGSQYYLQMCRENERMLMELQFRSIDSYELVMACHSYDGLEYQVRIQDRDDMFKRTAHLSVYLEERVRDGFVLKKVMVVSRLSPQVENCCLIL